MPCKKKRWYNISLPSLKGRMNNSEWQPTWINGTMEAFRAVFSACVFVFVGSTRQRAAIGVESNIKTMKLWLMSVERRVLLSSALFSKSVVCLCLFVCERLCVCNVCLQCARAHTCTRVSAVHAGALHYDATLKNNPFLFLIGSDPKLTSWRLSAGSPWCSTLWAPSTSRIYFHNATLSLHFTHC